MIKTLKLNLQLFADGESQEQKPNENKGGNDGSSETKTFTQDEVDKMVTERLAREKKKLREENDSTIDNLKKQIATLEKEKSFKDLNEEERAAKEREMAQAAQEKEIAELKNQLNEYRRQSRVSDVLQEYAKDAKVGVQEFGVVAPLIANIDNEDQRLEAYQNIVKLVLAVDQNARGDVLKQASPNGSSQTQFVNNPFLSGNLTEIATAIAKDKAEAEAMAKASGKYEAYKIYFSK